MTEASAPSETPPCFDDPFFVGTTGGAHGTGIAGIIAATCNNGIGVCGIAPDAKILSVKVGTQEEHDAARIPVSRILSRFPNFTVGQLLDLMLYITVVDLGAPGYDPTFGYGRGSAGLIP